MATVSVIYHREAEGVWAESPDVEGLAVAAATLAEARELVRDGLSFYLDDEIEIDLRESFVDALPALPVVTGLEFTGLLGFIQGVTSSSAGSAVASLAVPEPAYRRTSLNAARDALPA